MRGGLEHRVDCSATGDVGLQRDGAFRAELRGGRLRWGAAAPVVEHDPRTSPGECSGDRHAEAASGTGHQHDLMFEFHGIGLHCDSRPMYCAEAARR